MKLIKKFTAIHLGTTVTNDEVLVRLSFGTIEGPYYSRESPDEEFGTEEEAVEYAFKESPYGRWLILPIVRFDNYE